MFRFCWPSIPRSLGPSRLLKLLPLIVLILSSLPSELKAAPNKASTGLPADLACLRVRIAIDMGSTSTKMRSGIVNDCTQAFIGEVAKSKISLGLKDHLKLRPDDNKTFTSEFIDQATYAVIAAAYKLKAETIQKLDSEASWHPYKDLLAQPIEIAGVATEAMRQAKNSDLLLNKLKQENIYLQIIPQQAEGHLGFIGALAILQQKNKLNLSPEKVATWDIGGGSSQIVSYHGYRKLYDDETTEANQVKPWDDFGNKVAANAMKTFVVEDILGIKASKTSTDSDKTPNPLLSKDWDPHYFKSVKNAYYEKSRTYVSEHFRVVAEDKWLEHASITVYGIGGAHNGAIGFLRKLRKDNRINTYTQRDIDDLLDVALVSTDEELISRYDIKPENAKTTASNLLLINWVMDTINLESVEVLDVDNAIGAMIVPNYWKTNPEISPKNPIKP